MVNLRAKGLTIKTSSSIEVTFTASLDRDIGIANVTINPLGANASGLTVKSVSISGTVMTVSTEPMVPGAQYDMVLASTPTQLFRGARGEVLIEDGATNHLFFVGKSEDNEVLDAILESFASIYNTDDSRIRDFVEPGALEILANKHAGGEVQSANYVEVTVEDEEMTRGGGPFDRFAHEGVYQLLRVGSAEAGSATQKTLSYTAFPSDPISLQQVTVAKEVISNTSNQANSFDGLIVTLAQAGVIELLSLTLVRGSDNFAYDIPVYRYGLLDSRFDSANAYPALDLSTSQIRLSGAAVGPSFPLPQGSDTIEVSYIYKKGGRFINSDSVAVTANVETTRESVPAVATSFFLDHAPVVDPDTGSTPTSGGVQWLDPSQNFDPDVKHPAFLTEIPFSESSLPSAPGEFSVNYTTGQVLVFGVDGSGTDGSTGTPPVANYVFLRTFQAGLDYNYVSDLSELAAVDTPGRDLIGSMATILFTYEDGFADGEDFEFASHIEEIDERVDNRVISNFGLKTLHNPVTEVFRIFNETTGAVYQVSRISGNQVFFTGSALPELKTVSREAALFAEEIQDQIVVTEEVSISGKSFVAFQVELTQTDIGAATGDYIGASFNTSLTFDDATVFATEVYFDSDDSIADNLQRLQQVGDYVTDYVNGVVYVAVVSGSSTSIGFASYKYGVFQTRNRHVTAVNDVYRSTDPRSANVKTFDVSTIGDQLVSVSDLEIVGETEVSGSPIVVVSGALTDSITVSQDVLRLRHIFQVTDLQTTDDPVDFASTATILASSANTIVLNEFGAPVLDAGMDGAGLTVMLVGSRKYVEVERIANIVAGATQLAVLTEDTSDATFLQREYAAVDLQTGVDYFAMGSDGYIDAVNNRIYLPTGVLNSAVGQMVRATYRAKLLGGAAVLVDYTPGDIFIDYEYLNDELLVSYEYGDNVLDWSISDSLNEGETYFVSYKYGALRNSLRDNFGVLTQVEELATAPLSLERELYRSGLRGTLQSFLTGPTIPAIKGIVSAFTDVDPIITESVFLEWILGRDYLNLLPMVLSGSPTYVPGRFGHGILLDTPGQTAVIPATSNLRMSEGTWESFVVPEWDGTDNDAVMTADVLFDGMRDTSKVFLGAGNQNPSEIPFTLDRTDDTVLGRPTLLHGETGYFIWFDATYRQWHIRMRAPITEERVFTGSLTTTGQFNDVRLATEAEGYGADDPISEENDWLRSTDSAVEFSFVTDGYDILNMPLDAYDGYYAAFDGIDFQSDDVHYFFDTGAEEARNRMSLFKDGKGFLRYRVRDANGRVKELGANIKDWEAGSTHHVATSWRIGTYEQRDEMHLFVDGMEIPNTYRFRGYLTVPSGQSVRFMDEAGETLAYNVLVPTIGAEDMSTTAGSNIVSSPGATLITSGLQVGAPFQILDDTADGLSTRTAPYVYVKSIIDERTLELEQGPVGSAIPFNLTSSLNNVAYSVNPLTLPTVSDPTIEKVRVFAVEATGGASELLSPATLMPDYEFYRDGYQDYVIVNDGVNVGDSVVLLAYGLTLQRCNQLVYVWPHRNTNLLQTIMPQPTAVSKIDVTALIVRRTNIEIGDFAVVATVVGGHLVQVLVSNLDFCQPSDVPTGRRLTATIRGSNFDFSGLNQVILIGDTTDGYDSEILEFSETGAQTTTRFFTSLTNVMATFTPADLTKSAGTLEIKETLPITQPDRPDGYDAEYAVVHLSVVQQVGEDGTVSAGGQTFTAPSARFGASDINKLIVISYPASIAGVYVITDVDLDPSGTVKDSDTVTLSGIGVPWATSAADGYWDMLSVSHGDSGFGNGLITLERYGTGGMPFLLSSCWYEVDFPSYATIPWSEMPELLYTGSDINGANQAEAVIDELRVLGEMSSDTGAGETVTSSGRSITTDYQTLEEYTPTTQTLMLFHFNDCVANKAAFYSGFSGSYFQSSESVNAQFGQSGVFNQPRSLTMDNNGVFFNDAGTIEFWVSPILDTYNDPTARYYVDLSTEQQVEAEVLSRLRVTIPTRARSVSAVIVSGSTTNYFDGGRLLSDGATIVLGQPLPSVHGTVTVTYVPIDSQGDRFSILKDESGALTFLISASGADFRISAPVFWKKNTWHRVFVGWDLNNTGSQDRMILMVDGVETGVVRYGTGLRYGTGVTYGMPTVWGSALLGTTASRSLVSDINMTDFFSRVNVGGDFTSQFSAMARIDNLRFSNVLRSISYLGGTGPGRLIGHDFLYTSNINTAQPVIDDGFTTLMLDFDTTQALVEHLISVHDDAAGIFDFFVDVIDSFSQIPDTSVEQLIEDLINRLKPAHTRAFVDFGDEDC